MSTLSTAYDWQAPVPRPFTRAAGPTVWPTDRRYRPLARALRRTRQTPPYSPKGAAALQATAR